MLLPVASRRSDIAFAVAPVARRLVAAFIDCCIISAYALSLCLALLLVPQVRIWLSHHAASHVGAFLLLTIPAAGYLSLAEASSSGATLGKRLMGIRVISVAGGRLSVFQSMLRSAVRFIPWELAHSAIWRIHFGAEFSPHSGPFWLIAAAYALVLANIASQLFDRRRRALYDFIAGSQVEQATRFAFPAGTRPK